jgi:hypothetical protein
MMQTPGDSRDAHRAETAPSFFKYLVGASALLIAGCSAFFSVWGLGLLFVGSATAVMIMAASLEVGKGSPGTHLWEARMKSKLLGVIL